MNGLEILFKDTLQAQSVGVIGLSFAGGVVSSFLPCTIAMLPVLVGYMGGYSGASKGQILLQVCMFILGVSTVMTVLGVAAALLGLTFGNFVGSGWYYAVGAVAVLMGLQLLGIIHLPLPQLITRMPETKPGQLFSPFILGLAFGAASSPCGTPYLTAILGLISNQQNVALGGLSLFCYALGQGALLLAVGLFAGLLKHMAMLNRVGTVMNQMSAIVFILAGLILIAEGSGVLAEWMLALGLGW
jgi:cytochrome c-type biogenesis protein